ncbi:septal ring lytic transglycosylase RlpA family protein [Pseudemcibacter aquimaris]|uniref:septal ring lytic transglycosylase RlpA family protein n=1 Tax=Pseudemcibacter aquimaris TaxID=2857064 RepID=UPI002013291F|nr:septal ring lytic transglycosylase RlpA family protein [Pseudemcibacter aquimaris]MCC3860979.1 septal ring lytic transglycosylase RlpA family protein [Pseudemcibacter aquimaris]WDU59797.1 septal ring lytic transglycosylase RlpA family protein [Pseudemcibacter aquimaris]
MEFKKLSALFLCTAVLSACGGEGELQTSAPPAPSGEGSYKVGDPYQIAGKWYTPKEDPDYNQVGIASWYGPDFHNKQTANGEIFNMNDLTAAHTTLPMPSYVRVTNLANNRSLILKINDRGPFVGNRIIDVSRRSAQLLGFEERGTTRVRVEAVSGPDAPVQVARSSEPPPLERQSVAKVEVATLEVLEPLQVETTPAQIAAIDPGPAAPEAGDEIFVQVGAYSQIGNASRAITAVKHLGSIAMEGVTLNGRKLYRVRIGPLHTTTSANAALEQVLALGHNTAKVVFD